MHNWENFEIACVNYLRESFGDVADFEECGGSNSTTPDILVKSANGSRFYIEAKKSPTQCGQFVLFPNSERKVFEYSPQNNSKLNKFSQLIINHVNNDFDAYYCETHTQRAIQRSNIKTKSTSEAKTWGKQHFTDLTKMRIYMLL